MELKGELSRILAAEYAVEPENATLRQVYGAAVKAVQLKLMERYSKSVSDIKSRGQKRVYYLSMEFLIGRSLKNNLYNLGLAREMEKAVKSFGFTLENLYEMEPDAGLGNGGLGRLAACYLDSLTTLGYAATGFSIRYEFGVFKQVIMDGWQVEYPDNWLELGGLWLVPRPDEAQKIQLYGTVDEQWSDKGLVTVHRDYTTIQAIPYDLLISGKGERVNNLRIWSAKSDGEFDMSLFSRGEYLKSMDKEVSAEAISKVLYPADDHEKGKRLRLTQQYFFVSASLKSVVSEHLKNYNSLDNLPDVAVFHINDTHPALCVPELMRILMDEHGYPWDKAWDITTRAIAYTNHTVMSEALEVWDTGMFKEILPRIYSIIKEIDRRFLSFVFDKFESKRAVMDKLAIISGGGVRMANLCVVSAYSVNGVSALHSEILKNKLFKDYSEIFTHKFTNVTNGITHRRWLCEANPELFKLINELVGEGVEADATKLYGLLKYKDDSEVLERLRQIKYQNKLRLGKYISSSLAVAVDPRSIFDVQAKRLHEYKRQLLSILYAYSLYLKIKAGAKIYPRTFIYGAKASVGYAMAKEIIRFINAVAQKINSDASVSGMLKVVFLADYRVSLAELMIPAAEISEQISLAGKEASGTGNMKFMLNGALTIGTMDGANIEIFENVGADNMFLFGMDETEVEKAKAGYNPRLVYSQNPDLKQAIDSISRGDVGNFEWIVRYLIESDPYMVLADFESYKNTQARVENQYKDQSGFLKKSLINIAHAGVFSSDRSVKEYADRIWHI